MINSTCDDIKNGHYPVRSVESTGGAYFMIDSTGLNYVSVFKPIDEEPMAMNNPHEKESAIEEKVALDFVLEQASQIMDKLLDEISSSLF
ncbi:hypothetical protein K1719_009840 [Acacia pycnantha]|nr:hypothetical protein K1719_009840 [Acacia pycnantha]